MLRSSEEILSFIAYSGYSIAVAKEWGVADISQE